ncbi:hypothetical protein J2X63_002677 [Agromyces sp. 3263]|jgi:hypothetical protein|uniref:DUF6325 family protein n=1 Tax=Agromyces sp. 3263 TaxID=2817750 RepID=UPI002861E696|nr:DUF6325 family protein [Agromyces sp. 3263]MDR6906969.1 hypothetical protein [Agromyces sp. 3263]
MTDLEFGPVELVLAAFEGDRPKAGVLDAILDLADAGTVRLLDLVYVTRAETGEIEWIELDEAGIEIGEIDLAASGIASHEDLEELSGRLPLGTSALLLVVELTWAKHLASKLFEADGFVVDSVRIPAPVVNAVVEEVRAAGALTEN